ncbi:hypothetical protein WJX74_004842 [Apatococcus lobatus]|uniref:SnoaL-like domain-containing protein n=1 Tax=Apatococcus lobatus TaxID=904363 RepID=A0AAW1QNR5_9CHLO
MGHTELFTGPHRAFLYSDLLPAFPQNLSDSAIPEYPTMLQHVEACPVSAVVVASRCCAQQHHTIVRQRRPCRRHPVSQKRTVGTKPQHSHGLTAACKAFSSSVFYQGTRQDDPFGSLLVDRYYDAINARDLVALMDLFSPECMHDGLAYRQPFSGWQAVRSFYQDLFASLPQDVRFAQDDGTDGGTCTASVAWHLEDSDGSTPFGKGLTFFRWNEAGKIMYLRDSPEHVAKLSAAALPGLRVALPFLRSLARFLPTPSPATSRPHTSLNAAASKGSSGFGFSRASRWESNLEMRLRRLERQAELQQQRCQGLPSTHQDHAGSNELAVRDGLDAESMAGAAAADSAGAAELPGAAAPSELALRDGLDAEDMGQAAAAESAGAEFPEPAGQSELALGDGLDSEPMLNPDSADLRTGASELALRDGHDSGSTGNASADSDVSQHGKNAVLSELGLRDGLNVEDMHTAAEPESAIGPSIEAAGGSNLAFGEDLSADAMHGAVADSDTTASPSFRTSEPASEDSQASPLEGWDELAEALSGNDSKSSGQPSSQPSELKMQPDELALRDGLDADSMSGAAAADSAGAGSEDDLTAESSLQGRTSGISELTLRNGLQAEDMSTTTDSAGTAAIQGAGPSELAVRDGLDAEDMGQAAAADPAGSESLQGAGQSELALRDGLNAEEMAQAAAADSAGSEDLQSAGESEVALRDGLDAEEMGQAAAADSAGEDPTEAAVPSELALRDGLDSDSTSNTPDATEGSQYSTSAGISELALRDGLDNPSNAAGRDAADSPSSRSPSATEDGQAAALEGWDELADLFSGSARGSASSQPAPQSGKAGPQSSASARSQPNELALRDGLDSASMRNAAAADSVGAGATTDDAFKEDAGLNELALRDGLDSDSMRNAAAADSAGAKAGGGAACEDDAGLSELALRDGLDSGSTHSAGASDPASSSSREDDSPSELALRDGLESGGKDGSASPAADSASLSSQAPQTQADSELALRDGLDSNSMQSSAAVGSVATGQLFQSDISGELAVQNGLESGRMRQSSASPANVASVGTLSSQQMFAASSGSLSGITQPAASGLSELALRDGLDRGSSATAVASPQAASPWTGNLSGVWVKDMEASNFETYGQALDVMRLNGLQRTTALRLIEGVEIRHDPDSLSVEFLTVVPFFRVKEPFSFRSQTSMGRRDLRPGSQYAQLSQTPEGLRANIHWNAPLPGVVQEDFICPDANTLHVTSCVTVEGQSATTTQVYHRVETWTPKNKMTPGAFGLSSFPWNPWAGNSY